MEEDKQPQINGEKEMSFVEHLDELRQHLIRSIIAIVACAIFIFFATKFIFKVILFGPLEPNFLTYQGMCALSKLVGLGEAMCYEPIQINMQTLDMGEAFLLHIKVCIFGGIIIAFPYLLWEIWRFVRPGLHQHEQKATRGFVIVASILFLLGVSFGYFIISPFAINFLAGYQLPMINQEADYMEVMRACTDCCTFPTEEVAKKGGIIKASSFINYMLMFTFPTGLLFELPILVFFLARMGIITADLMRQYRRHSIIIILVLAALVTPPDVMTQILIGIPIYILYELSIGIAVRQEKRRKRDE
ncbi:MAG: twin-arginine translocase subunit TatC [Saprospiraceae bacterium]|nr:twin-arginine translocase subunit TatC [Saprospiraceae bacterium]